MNIQCSETKGSYSQFDILDANSMAIIQNLALKTVQDLSAKSQKDQAGQMTLTVPAQQLEIVRNALGSLGVEPKEGASFSKSRKTITLSSEDATKFTAMMDAFQQDGIAVRPENFYGQRQTVLALAAFTP
jgi:hypothetical protein